MAVQADSDPCNLTDVLKNVQRIGEQLRSDRTQLTQMSVVRKRQQAQVEDLEKVNAELEKVNAELKKSNAKLAEELKTANEACEMKRGGLDAAQKREGVLKNALDVANAALDVAKAELVTTKAALDAKTEECCTKVEVGLIKQELIKVTKVLSEIEPIPSEDETYGDAQVIPSSRNARNDTS